MSRCDNADLRKFAPRWWAYTDYTPVIPKFYWDVYSQEERIKTICEYLWKSICFTENTADNFHAVQDALDKLQAEFEKFQESGFNDYYEAQVREWVSENLDYVFTQVAKQVYFGLNLEGYFVAYVPQSWDDIVFDTGHVYSEDTYGRLILRWDTEPDNTETVNQMPEIVR